MGIVGLWDALSGEISKCELTKWVLQEGLERSTNRKYRLGIDANIWFYLCTAPFAHGIQRSGNSQELEIFFNKLVRLAKLPVDIVFVFDGARKPPIKRGMRVVEREHFLYKGMISFIEAFGFCHHSAPAEAEAELAYMNMAGLIDAVVTDDSDIFLFGGHNIIRNWNIKKNGEFIHLRKWQVESFSREALILFGLLTGGDYDNKKGLHGCGEEVALSLAAEDFGDRLCAAATSLSTPDFDAYLCGWRSDIRSYLRENPKGTMLCRHPALADSVPDSFPNTEILQLYLNPIVSSPKALKELALDCCLADVAAVTHLCELHFSWGSRHKILSKLTTSLLPSIIMSILANDAIRQDSPGPVNIQSPVPAVLYMSHNLFPDTLFTVGKQQILCGVLQHEIAGSVKYVQQSIISSLRGLREVSNSNRTSMPGQFTGEAESKDSSILKICIPTLLLKASLGNKLGSGRSATALNISVAEIRAAFTKPDIDISSLSWLTMAYFNSHQMSSESILDVIEALCEVIADPSQAPLFESIADLIRRYIHLCRTYPPSIPRTYTLDPMARVLNKVKGGVSSDAPSCHLLLSQLLAMTSAVTLAETRIVPLNEGAASVHPSSSTAPEDLSNGSGDFNGFDAFCVSEGLGPTALYQFDE